MVKQEVLLSSLPRLNSGNQIRITIFRDSIFRGIRVREFNNEIKKSYAKFKTIPGSESTMLTQL